MKTKQKKEIKQQPQFDKHKEYAMKNKCSDCGKKIYTGSVRCKYCNNRYVAKQPEFKIRKFKKGEDSPHWKGDDVGYTSLHEWIKKRKPKTLFCQCCNSVPPYDLANISNEYKRDLNDWEWLCRKCHMHKDGRAELVKRNLKQFKIVCYKCNKEINKFEKYISLITYDKGIIIEQADFHFPSCWQEFNQEKVNQRFKDILKVGVGLINRGVAV